MCSCVLPDLLEDGFLESRKCSLDFAGLVASRLLQVSHSFLHLVCQLMNFLSDDCLIVSGAFGERLSQIVQHVLKSTLESRGQNASENVPITKEEELH